MGREVEYTEEFESWWNRLTVGEQERIDAMVNLLRREGTALGYPRSSQVKTSRHSHMRELRVTTPGGRSGSSTHSTREGQRSC